MIFKKIIVNLISLALGGYAFITSAAGSMEYLQDKNYFGLGENAGILFTLLFSFFVFAFSFYGFKMFIYNLLDNKDKKK